MKKLILFLILSISLFSFIGCKKKVFSSLEFKGKCIQSFSGVPLANCTIVLNANKKSLISKAGITKSVKEICRVTADAKGIFTMKLKWLDSRDNYTVEIYQNNYKLPISSGNNQFSNYKALNSNTIFEAY